MKIKFVFNYYLRRFSHFLIQKYYSIHGLSVSKSSIFKRETLKSLIINYSIETVVETGTYLGDTTKFVSKYATSVYSIEVGKQLATMAARRFKNFPKIKILEGDSGDVLSELLLIIDCRALYFLDGHFSEGITSKSLSYSSPLTKELLILSQSKNLSQSIIVIDDAHELINNEDYPTENEIIKIFEGKPFNLLKVHNLLILVFI